MKKSYFKYINPTPFDKSWGIYVTTVGYSKVKPHDHYPTQRHPQSHQLTWNRGRILNDYYIIFISRGKGLFGSSTLSKPVDIVEGTSFFLYPGIWHRYKPNPREGWEEYWVGFNGFYVEKLMAKVFYDRKNPFVYLGLNKEILILFKNLIENVQSSATGFPQHIAGVTLQILGLIKNIALHHEYSNDPVSKLIAKAKFIMQDSLEDALDMEKLSKELPMGYSAFRKAFKRITGESPNQYHLNLRLERAKY